MVILTHKDKRIYQIFGSMRFLSNYWPYKFWYVSVFKSSAMYRISSSAEACLCPKRPWRSWEATSGLILTTVDLLEGWFNRKSVWKLSQLKLQTYLIQQTSSWKNANLFSFLSWRDSFHDLQGSSRFHRFHLLSSVSPATGRCKASQASSAKDVVLRRRSLVAAIYGESLVLAILRHRPRWNQAWNLMDTSIVQ